MFMDITYNSKLDFLGSTIVTHTIEISRLIIMLFLSVFTGKPRFPPNELMTSTPRLDSFVGSRSWLLFDKLGAVGNWMSAEVVDWNEDDEYKMILRVLKDLKVVNDLAEQCIKDIQEYANLSKDSAHRDNILLVVSDHRGVFQDLRKQALQMNL